MVLGTKYVFCLMMKDLILFNYQNFCICSNNRTYLYINYFFVIVIMLVYFTFTKITYFIHSLNFKIDITCPNHKLIKNKILGNFISIKSYCNTIFFKLIYKLVNKNAYSTIACFSTS